MLKKKVIVFTIIDVERKDDEVGLLDPDPIHQNHLFFERFC